MKKEIFLLFILLLLFGCATNSIQPIKENEAITVSVKLIQDEETVFEESKEFPAGINGLDALKKFMEVKYKEYALGVFVEELNGVKPGTNSYWALYVNGEYADKAINGYNFNSDTEIKWRLEKVKT